MYKINWGEETTLLQLHNCSSLGYTTCKYKKANSVPQAHLTPNQIRRKSTGTKREWSVLKKLYSPSITIIPTPMSINDSMYKHKFVCIQTIIWISSFSITFCNLPALVLLGKLFEPQCFAQVHLPWKAGRNLPK